MNTAQIPGLALPRYETAAVSFLMFAATVLVAINSLRAVSTPVPTAIGLVLLAAAGGWAVLAPGDTLPLAPTIAATITPAVLCLVVPWAVEIRHLDGLWHLGGAAALLLLVGLRGRLAAAWTGMAAASAITLIWGAFSVYGLPSTFGILIRQVALLVIGTLFIKAIRRLRRRSDDLVREASRLTALEAAAAAAADERRNRLHWARTLAAPLLQAIAEHESLDAGLRLQASLVEAELRDGLRAPSLAAEPVSSAARRARERGVEVVLLDDRAIALDGATGTRLRERVARELDATSSGRFVARLPPEGRTPLATVLVDGPEGRRLELTRDS